MKRAICLALAIPAFFAFAAAKSFAEPNDREATCYVVVEEGTSAEGNSLFMKKMGLDPQILSFVAPTRFALGATPSYHREGSFSYESGESVLVERRGAWALYSVPIRFRAEPYPQNFAISVVDIKITDLAKTRDVVQPGAKAIELAASRSGLKSGLAWVIGMEMPTRSVIRVRVALAR